MATSIYAKQALTSQGWKENIRVEIDEKGRIAQIEEAKPHSDNIPARLASGPEHKVGILLPAMSNLHSHSFQRAMAGLAESKSTHSHDDFWTWRKVMYRFLDLITPEDTQAIAAQVQMEMIASGYAASAEFHYVHHDQNGNQYAQIDELSTRHFSAALQSGIGYTHLPVLYMQGGLDGRGLQGGQLRFGCNLDQFNSLYQNLKDNIKNLPEDAVLGVAPHSLRAVTKQGLEACIALASEGPIHIHAAEQITEVQEVTNALGAPPIRWLLDNMPIDKRWCLIHATHMNNSEIRDFALSGAVAGLCPITEVNLGDGIFAANQFLMQGGYFGIGSDSNVKIALSEELRMLEVSQRLRDKKRLVLCDDRIRSNGRFLYEQAAVGGARALGRNAGKIEVGMLADLVALDENHPSIVGLKTDQILDTWIFSCNDNLVHEVWAAGRHVLQGGIHFQQDHISGQFLKTIKKLRSAL